MKRTIIAMILLVLAFTACSSAGGDTSSVPNPEDGVEVVVYRSPS